MKLHEIRIFVVLGIVLALSHNPAHAASVADIALYRGADRQAMLEREIGRAHV